MSRSTGAAAQPAGSPAVSGVQACAAATDAAGGGALTLNQLSSVYGISSLQADGLNGLGQTVALYELAQYSPADVGAYESCFGLSSAITSEPPVDGVTPAASAGGTAEADLDIEQVSTQAPGATIAVYSAANTDTTAYDLWSELIEGPARPQIISTSWGACEDDYSSALTSYGPLFQQAAAQGQTILAASGDSGSEDCAQDATMTSPPSYAGSLEVDYPGSDPNVISVGGTTYDPATGTEVAWNDSAASSSPSACAASHNYQGAGGGGESLYEPRPSWQPDVYDWASPQPCGTRCREVPDLSANAGYPMEIYAGAAWQAYGGTSFAAPMIAGLLADRDQGCSIAPGDIKSGNNDLLGTYGLYQATTGYDLATGLGSPQAQGLACPEVESISASSGSSGDSVTVTGVGLEAASITFGGSVAKIDSESATSATVEVPSGTGTVVVQAASGGMSGTATAQFSYLPSSSPAPAPTSGGGGGGATTGGGSGGTTVPTGGTTGGGTAPSSGGGGGIVTDTGSGPTGSLPSPCASAAGRPLGGAAGIAAVSIGGCDGYFVVNSAGAVAAFGSAKWHGDLSGYHLAAPIIAMEATPDGGGYWLLGADGGVFNFGDARFYGSTGGVRLNAPVVGMAVTPDNGGYWIVAKDGGVFTFGDARFYGSTGNLRLAAPVDGIAVAPGGLGYWLVASDGGVFTFTSDGFYGSLGGVHLAKPIVGMSSTPNGRGYTLVGSDGGVFSFGDAPFYGSLGGHPPATPIVDLSPAPGNNGYYLVSSGGTVYTFGPGARNFGSV
jgi:hypothetical protein